MSWKERATPVTAKTGGWKDRATKLQPEKSATNPDAEPIDTSTFFLKGAMDEAGKLGNALIHGRNIGEHMPGGEAIADAGSAIGAGVVAATKSPFSEKSFGDLYDEARRPMLDQVQREKAADDASTTANFVKGTLASLPIGAMKGASPAVAQTAKQPPGWLSSQSKYSVNPAGSAKAAHELDLGTEVASKATDPKMQKMKEWLIKKAKDGMIDEGINMIPSYPLRRGARFGWEYMKKKKSLD